MRSMPCWRSSSSLLLGDLLVAAQQDLARLRVLHVVCGDASEDLLDGDRDLLDARLLHLAQGELGELAPFLHQQLVGARVAHVARGLDAHQVIGLEELGRLAALQHDRVPAVEVVEDVLGGHAERAQHDRGVELAPPVDAHEQDVLRVELEVDPGSAVGNDARRVEELAAGVRLALVVVEEDAGRAVELRHDHALGAVHHEGAVPGHQRDLAEVDLLLLHVLDGAGAALRVDVPDHQLDRHLERRGERHAALMALVDVVLGLAERVADELERGGLVEVLDREDRLEDRLQALILARLGRHVALQKLLVGPLLDVDQVRDVDDLLDAPERAPESQVVRNVGHLSHRVTHRCSCLPSARVCSPWVAMLASRLCTT